MKDKDRLIDKLKTEIDRLKAEMDKYKKIGENAVENTSSPKQS